MILVDSSVWIDYFKGISNWQTDALHWLLDRQPLAIGDLMLTEVLQGTATPRAFDTVNRLLNALTIVDLGGQVVAVEAARNFQVLRSKGITIRKTIDTIIATRCLLGNDTLLHKDRDFVPFEKHFGLKVVT